LSRACNLQLNYLWAAARGSCIYAQINDYAGCGARRWKFQLSGGDWAPIEEGGGFNMQTRLEGHLRHWNASVLEQPPAAPLALIPSCTRGTRIPNSSRHTLNNLQSELKIIRTYLIYSTLWWPFLIFRETKFGSNLKFSAIQKYYLIKFICSKGFCLALLFTKNFNICKQSNKLWLECFVA